MTPRSSCIDWLSEMFSYEHVVLFGRARAGLAAVVEEVGGATAPILFPSNICVAVLAAASTAGTTPVLVPVSSESGLVDDDRLAEAVCNNPSSTGIVMPVHMYGMLGNYEQTYRAAANRSWFVLENDSLAATIGLDRERRASGDALLLSFGSGKTIDAQGGGAVLTDDRSLALALSRRIEHWPPVSESDERTETNLAMARRYLHALGHPEASECLLGIDVENVKKGFNDDQCEAILDASNKFPSENELRHRRLAQWYSALDDLAPGLGRPSITPRTPWRAVFRCEKGCLRDVIVERLRKRGFDAGTNYPPLTDFFPRLLQGQEYDDAKRWGDTVLTLWLTTAYDDAGIRSAASIIHRAFDAVRACSSECQ
jgi:dTDP-4-amino-4,6-dideoxygalactose transaminase